MAVTLRPAVYWLACALCLLTACTTIQSPSATRIEAAIVSPVRTDSDRKLDDSRKPREFLRFIGLREGDRVLEINAGAGYNARLLPTVVGDTGRVYATNADFVLKLFDGINERLRESVKNLPNVQVSTQRDDSIAIPERVRVAILNNNYHDLHWQKVNVAKFNRAVYNALQPGGYFIVGDHHAIAGSGTEHVGTLHRIDRDIVVSEIEAAGFRLVASADFLANAKDDRQVFVIDPEIRGKTDRFLLKFQRPE